MNNAQSIPRTDKCLVEEESSVTSSDPLQKKHTEISSGNDVVKNVLKTRACRSNKIGHSRSNPPYTSRRDTSGSRSNCNDDGGDTIDARFAIKHTQRQSRRRSEQNERSVENRGGMDLMGKFIFDNERKLELKRLQEMADEINHIPDELVEEIEQDLEDELSDSELIEYFDKKEKYEEELEDMLAELSLNS